MCGIAGVAWTSDSAPFDQAVLRRMIDAIAHRGPDDAGTYASLPSPGPGAVLGHRRLSIIDIGGGHQPLSNEDGTVWIAFNGEIYNYKELQASLTRRGHTFRTSSDTETIVHLYEQYGPDCVSQLRGMFAFAIWDQNERTLFLARDRLGKKPLVYRHEAQRLMFASELKALLQVPGVPRELDRQAVDDYLTYQYVPHPQSILKGYSKLPPAHWALYQDGKLRVERYWRPAYSPPPDRKEFASLNEARSELRETLTTAVKLRMRSDVPLGAFLSGGVDSTIIAGLMQSLSSRPVKTFSIGFPVAAFDERTYAREAAKHLGTEHHEQVVEPSALQILPQLIWHYDEPFADSSAIPTMYLSEMTRREVTVSLSGDGGDELFAGYKRYQAVKLGGWADRLPQFLRNWMASPVWQQLPASVRQNSKRRRLKRLLSAMALEPRQRYLKWVSIFDDERRADLYTPEFRASLGGHDSAEFLLQAYEECPDRDFVTRTTCADVLTYLPCDILTKVDIASMAFALEARSPFLDHEVVDFAARLPIEWKMRGRHGKQILVDTFADLLPKRIQTRAKMGFGVPLDHWFRNELRPLIEDVLLAPASLNRGLFQPAQVRRLVDEHVRGAWDHSYRLWSLLVLELWQRTFLDGAVPSGRHDVRW
ncbi:MAG: asparagine synthase (glutamine-hydrolyzing) [Planctomycetota bacterium]